MYCFLENMFIVFQSHWEKIHNKIVKFGVENIEHLRCVEKLVSRAKKLGHWVKGRVEGRVGGWMDD